ncbi:hypothetical protein NL676_013480 [Syzygium grande]|nr:hypothetical protein NL676_013480 [Syzygium grande]
MAEFACEMQNKDQVIGAVVAVQNMDEVSGQRDAIAQAVMKEMEKAKRKVEGEAEYKKLHLLLATIEPSRMLHGTSRAKYQGDWQGLLDIALMS